MQGRGALRESSQMRERLILATRPGFAQILKEIAAQQRRFWFVNQANALTDANECERTRWWQSSRDGPLCRPRSTLRVARSKPQGQRPLRRTTWPRVWPSRLIHRDLGHTALLWTRPNQAWAYPTGERGTARWPRGRSKLIKMLNSIYFKVRLNIPSDTHLAEENRFGACDVESSSTSCVWNVPSDEARAVRAPDTKFAVRNQTRSFLAMFNRISANCSDITR
jgi:hypothetical protein